MSFYGNSYHYTAESFAKVVLKNSGLGRYLTDPSNGYTEIPSNSDFELNAIHREGGLGIQSGNHWIKLASNPDSFEILHNTPGSKDKLIVPFGIASDDEKTVIGTVNENNVLDFNDVLIIPTISYDAAGHIADIAEAAVYQMPSNPVEDIRGRVNAIDGKDGEPTGGSLQKQLRDEMSEISTKMDRMQDDEDPNSLISKLTAMEARFNASFKEFQSSQQLLTKLDKEIYGDEATSYTGLYTRVYNLEK